MNLKTYIREIKNFPSKGVVFKDITPLLKDAVALSETTEALLALIGNHKIDKIVGIESRGFFFAPILASKLNVGLVPVRKNNKLPATKIIQTYNLEYGSDTLEIHQDGIMKGEKVLVHDDILATGGTASATCKLIERLGGEVVQCNFLIALDFLKGIDKLDRYEVKSLMHY